MKFRSGFGAAFAALLAASSAVHFSCNSDRTTNVFTQVYGVSAEFPGDPAFTNALSSDLRAFSDPGLSFSGMRRFDSGRGESVFLFDVANGPGPGRALYASHFDGSRFTPPVEIRGVNQDSGSGCNLNQAFVAFLFPGNYRDFDAVIGFIRNDLDDTGGSPSAGANSRLYISYFDRTHREVAVLSGSPTVKHGFQTWCQPIDLTDDSFAGADVTLAGFLSSGTIGATSFNQTGGLAGACSQGETTSWLLFFWTQAASVASPVRLHYSVFDLTEANSGNQAGSAAAIGLDAAAAATATVLANSVTACSNVLMFLKQDLSDTVLSAAVFDPSALAFAANSYAVSPAGSFTDVALLPGPSSVFGPEAGLTRVVGVFGFTGGAVDLEKSLYAFQIDHSAPSSAFTPVSDLVELDSGSGSAGSPYDVDLAQAAPPSINRTGEWISVPFLQAQSAPPAAAVAALWVNVILAPRSTAPAAMSSAVSGATRLDQATSAGPGVDWFVTQSEVGYRGIQSSRNALCVAWKQDLSAGVDDTLRARSFTVNPVAPPIVTAGSAESIAFLEGDLLKGNVLLMDGGGQGGTAGTPVIYYIRNFRTASEPSMRACQFRTGAGSIEIGSLTTQTAGTYHFRQATSITARTLPRNRDVVSNPDWAGSWQHVFVGEYRYLESAGSASIRHRVFLKDSTQAGSADRFVPVADGLTAPAGVDVDEDLTPQWLDFAASSGTAAVFFKQGGRIWYNEFSSSTLSWRSSPAVVDDAYPEPSITEGVLKAVRRDSLDDLSGTAVYWSNDFSPNMLQQELRAQIRVRR